MAPWLALPTVLRRMGITVAPLPCLVVGDASQRFAHHPRPALLSGCSSRSAAQTTMALPASIAAEHRPGQLAILGRMTLTRPNLAARTIAPLLGLTLSGAGKLLERTTRLGMLVKVSGRATWRTYVTPDVALPLGLVPPTRGLPPASPAPSPALGTVLATFDAEMGEIDARLARIGSSQGGVCVTI